MAELEFYDGAYSGAQIDSAIGKVIGADTTPTSGSADMITSGAMFTALERKGDVKQATAYASTPNGQLVVTIPNPRNLANLAGFLVLSSYSTTPPKSDLYFFLMSAASYSTRFSTLISNLGLSSIAMNYDSTAKTLTLTFDSNARYMQANAFVVL